MGQEYEQVIKKWIHYKMYTLKSGNAVHRQDLVGCPLCLKDNRLWKINGTGPSLCWPCCEKYERNPGVVIPPATNTRRVPFTVFTVCNGWMVMEDVLSKRLRDLDAGTLKKMGIPVTPKNRFYGQRK